MTNSQTPIGGLAGTGKVGSQLQSHRPRHHQDVVLSESPLPTKIRSTGEHFHRNLSTT
jgi:hypothetical protein